MPQRVSCASTSRRARRRTERNGRPRPRSPRGRNDPAGSAELGALPTHLENLEEVARAADRKPVGELEEMLIPGDDQRSLTLGQCKQVVVVRVNGAARRR